MLWIWIGFVLLILFLLALDLGVLNRKAHVIGVKEALGWSAFWIALGLLFSTFVYFGYEKHWLGLGLLSPDKYAAVEARAAELNVPMDQLPVAEKQRFFVDKWSITADNPHGLLDGSEAVARYLFGYVVEKSLSVDNIFVIAMIFGFLAVPALYQHRVLFWGILGALIMRGIMIALGTELIMRYSWVIYVFGGFLIFTGLKMLVIKTNDDPRENFLVRWVKRIFPVTDKYHGQHFFVRAGSSWSHEAETPGAAVERDEAVERMEKLKPGTLMITPLFLALLLVEFTDVIFAVDSIPAIFGITTDPFLVFTSNVFAILGLRSLYFALAGMIEKFHYLKVALAAVLVVVGVKMMTHVQLKAWLGANYNLYMLGLVLLILTAGVVGSLLRKPPAESEVPVAPGTEKV
jgi:tellurite resistance protein TerC